LFYLCNINIIVLESLFISKENDVEWANVITHFIGILFSIFAYFHFLPYYSSNIGLYFFVFGLFAVYTSSTLYHLFSRKSVKYTFRLLDHLAIFLLIGGTHLPFIYGFTEGKTREYLVITIISLVLLGFVYKIFFFESLKRFSLFYYLALGWFAVIDIPLMWSKMPIETFIYIMAGGISYTVGTIFYKMVNLKYHHAIWHIFVIFGSYFHYLAINIMLKN